MNSKQMFRYLALLIAAVLAVVLVVTSLPTLGARARTDVPISETFVSPLPTPTPTLEPLSREAEIVLNYLAEQHDVPVETLQVVNEHRRSYPLIGRTFKAFTIWTTDPAQFQAFDLLIDLDTGAVEANVNAVAALEKAAYRAKYGKLHPELYDRLQKVGDAERLPVTVWLASDSTTRTQAEVFAELVDRYPGAAEAQIEKGVPWAVTDIALAEEIRKTYFRILSEDTTQRMHPLVDQLKALGAEVTTFEPMPSAFAQLPKPAILALAEREDIDLIYLLEGETVPGLTEATATDRLPGAWYQGSLSGVNRRVAVLEPDNIQNTGCLNIIASRAGTRPPGYDPNHKTWVASVLSCNNTTHRGIAYNASLIDAGYNGNQTNPDMASAVLWAVQTQNADVVNISAGFITGSTLLEWTDRVMDYWARYGPSTIVVLAHNQGGIVTSPGKGWNVITVGAIDDQGNSDWADDVMAGFSNYINPSSAHSDHEKPDLVAPGANITMIGPGGTPVAPAPSGTSFSAPQVAGLAALLMNRNGALVDRPEAVKAVLMASAAHNIQDSRVMPSGQDLRDGAGSIDAALADQTASLGYGANNNTTCNRPCWWATDTLYVAPGSAFTRSFQASRGERIRVAIAWLSLVDPLYATDTLGVDYNLQVLAPSGGQVTDGYSASWDNSNELVEFVAPEAGTYTIRMIRSASDTSSQSTEIGIAWSKQATYLPDVRRNDSGWDSTLTIRNDGTEPRDVTVTYFFANGNFAANQSTNLQPNASWSTSLYSYFSNFQGSAIVDGSEDLSVVVESEGDSRKERMNYTGITAPGGSPGWEAVGATLYAPVVKREYYGRSSALRITNTGNQSTDVYVDFYNATGAIRTIGPYPLAAGAHMTRYPSEGSGNSGGCTGTGTLCSAVIRSQNNQPLAATVDEDRDSDGKVAIDYNIFSAGALSIYFPLVKNHWFNMNTGLGVQNVGSAATTVTFSFYTQAGGSLPCTIYRTLAPFAATVVYDDACLGASFLGSALVTANQPLVGMANEASQDGRFKKAYSSFQGGSLTAYAPLVYRAFNESGYSWDSGVGVQNLTNQSANVTLTWYDTSGAQSGAPTQTQIAGRGSQAFFAPQTGFKGSVVITANQPIAAVVNVVNSAASGDTHAVYNASNR